ncbi:hypothetical protein QR680_007139 [Steinernema hermaphroditum]|uniref:Uncharacterized protein n=1 Tax=Steinernema hermaphroditum TaxID=289476 RepID=A0AA39HXQ7_9BILA|nr:hypothetical protein QR680_007139 [Steinernema hermaphroditum]
MLGLVSVLVCPIPHFGSRYLPKAFSCRPSRPSKSAISTPDRVCARAAAAAEVASRPTPPSESAPVPLLRCRRRRRSEPHIASTSSLSPVVPSYSRARSAASIASAFSRVLSARRRRSTTPYADSHPQAQMMDQSLSIEQLRQLMQLQAATTQVPTTTAASNPFLLQQDQGSPLQELLFQQQLQQQQQLAALAAVTTQSQSAFRPAHQQPQAAPQLIPSNDEMRLMESKVAFFLMGGGPCAMDVDSMLNETLASEDSPSKTSTDSGYTSRSASNGGNSAPPVVDSDSEDIHVIYEKFKHDPNVPCLEALVFPSRSLASSPDQRDRISSFSLPMPVFNRMVDNVLNTSYIRETLLNEPRRGITFVPSEWNLFERTSKDQPRTNNGMEAWHGIINRSVSRSPTMTGLLNVIEREELYARQVYREYTIKPSKGLRQRSQRFNYKQHSKELHSIVDQYDDYKENPVDYLQKLAVHCSNGWIAPQPAQDEEHELKKLKLMLTPEIEISRHGSSCDSSRVENFEWTRLTRLASILDASYQQHNFWTCPQTSRKEKFRRCF